MAGPLKNIDTADLVRRAREAKADDLDRLIYHRSEDVLMALLDNPHLRELQKIRLLRRRDLPPKFFQHVAGRREWVDEYAVRLALAKNPKTPRYVFSAVIPRFLIMDLVKVANDPYVSADRKVFLNRTIAERVPTLPLGTKLNIAKRAGPEVVEALLLDDPPEKLVRAVLPSRFMSERTLIRAVGASMRQEPSLSAVATHTEWGKRYGVRLALAKNPALHKGHRERILAELNRYSLTEILNDCPQHPHIVEAVHLELARRPADGRAAAKRPLSPAEIEQALGDLKKRRKGAPRKSAGEIRGAVLEKDAMEKSERRDK